MRRLDGAKFQRLAKHSETQRGHERSHKSKNMERRIREDETKDRKHMKTLSYASGLGVSQRRWSLAFLAVNIILEDLIVLSQMMVALHSPYVHSMQPLPVTLGAVAQNTTC